MPSSSAPASILIPALPSDLLSHGTTLQGSDQRHFITKREFELWSQTHPSVRPPPVGPLQPMPQPGEGKGYRAPQHPVSHLLQSIPPRAPSRSSRSNILSYTLHLSTTTRLSSYTSSNGSRSLLHRAEDTLDTTKITLDEEWLESELKAQGMWKLSASLLRANRREGHLPTSVERRVALASLSEQMLANPAPERAIIPVDNIEATQASDRVEAVLALKPLTSPDTTTLYLSTSAGHPTTSRPSSSSVAQSLIDLKFSSGVADGDASTALPDSKPHPLSESSLAALNNSVFATTSSSSSTRDLTATPHMDYRIVRGQAMRTRAREIFSVSPLPTSSTTWCRRHRVGDCSVCPLVVGTKVDRRVNVPGQGLDGEAAAGRRRLIELVPAFLELSAGLLKDARERANGGGEEMNDFIAANVKLEAGSEVEVAATATWYNLLHSLVVQACLEGYLVDGWTGTGGIETLFGVGCGVWEGRGWASRVAQSHASFAAKALEEEDDQMDEDDGSDSGSEDSEASEEAEEMEKEAQRARLVDAAQALFGSRDIAQADFERSMRDKIHEFLNVPEHSTLSDHLNRLNTAYPLSKFETDMYEFLEATTRLLGKPALARQFEQSTQVKPNPLATGEPDLWALARYFARVEPVPTSNAGDAVGSIWEESVSKGKRRKVD